MDVTRELSAAQRRKSIASALAEALHHFSGTKPSTCDTRVVEGAANDASRGQNTITRAQEAAGTEFFTFLDKKPAAGEQPGPVEDPRSQKRVQRHTVDQIVETFVPVQILGDPLPQMVENLVEVFQLLDIVVPEQVIDVRKISQDRIPQCSVDRDPQRVEQLVEVPTVVSSSFLQQHSLEQTVDIPVHDSVKRARGGLPGSGFNGVFWGSGCIAEDSGEGVRGKGRGAF